MKKIIALFLAVLLGALMLVTNAAAKPCPWRNKHCRPQATATVTISATQMRTMVVPVSSGTPVYVCFQIGCVTPGKP